MAFADRPTPSVPNVLAGVDIDPNTRDVLSFTTFEDGLFVGRFAKLDTGSLDNLDASVTPVLAGVTVRNPANPLEDGNTFTVQSDGRTYGYVDVLRAGYITIDVVDGQTPAMFGDVFAVNLATAEAGKARTDATDAVATNFEFISAVDGVDNVWVIRAK